MNFWTAIVIIVIVSSVAKVLRARYQAHHGIIEDRHGRVHIGAFRVETPAAPDPAAQREIEALRERIKVLERIATEGRQSRDLADEIESLRDR